MLAERYCMCERGKKEMKVRGCVQIRIKNCHAIEWNTSKT